MINNYLRDYYTTTYKIPINGCPLYLIPIIFSGGRRCGKGIRASIPLPRVPFPMATSMSCLAQSEKKPARYLHFL